MDDNAAVCTNCGFAKDSGSHFCPNCGSQTMDGADFCMGCGANVHRVYTGTVLADNAKSRLAAALLGIFLGGLGIHNFYLGYTRKGIAQLLISVLSCGILSFASGIWGLVEAIMILTKYINTDADGVPLKD